MNIDFFNISCKENAREDSLFGICDDKNGKKAYTDIGNKSNWIATVENDNLTPVTFIAIDNCTIILKEDGFNRESSCDGMLIFKDSIYFIELKSERADWISDAIKQLESTIKFFIENHDTNLYKHKKAFVCNKRHPHFHTIDNEKKLRFFRNYGFRIDIQGTIVIK